MSLLCAGFAGAHCAKKRPALPGVAFGATKA